MGTVGDCNHADYFEPDSGADDRIYTLRRAGTPPEDPPLVSKPHAVLQALPMVILLFTIALFVAAAIARSYR